MIITKTGQAQWQGDLKSGKGHVSVESGAFKDVPYGFNTRFEGQKGTNPEELVGAAHAGCFSMALSKILGEAGIVADDISTQSQVSLEQKDGGFSVTKIHLITTIKAGGADKATVEDCAAKAKAGCPISKLFNADITMAAEVIV